MDALAENNDVRKLISAVREDLFRLIQELVRTNSVAVPPEGNETPAQLVLAEFLKTYGLDAELYDTGFLLDSPHPYVRRDRHYAGRKNLVLRIPGTGRGRSLLFTGHIDTVPKGPGNWSESPWSGSSRNGRIYGRGSADMKGGLAAQFAVACALAKAGIRPGGDLIFESVVDEEWGGCGGTLAGRLRGDNADACVIGETTSLTVTRATRGGYIFDLEWGIGDLSNYFSEEEVPNPVAPLAKLLEWVDGLAAERRKVERAGAYAEFPDPVPVQVVSVEANPRDPNIPITVPTTAAVRIYIQFLPHEDVPSVIAGVRRSFENFCADNPFFQEHPPAWRPVFEPALLGHELPADHDWTRCLLRSAETVLGKPAVPVAAPYPCDAFMLQREFGIPTLIFGPTGAGHHQADEYVEIESVIDSATVGLSAALEWCGSKGIAKP